MGLAKMEIERFNGKGDFALWRQRMKAILVQMKISKAIDTEAKHAESVTAEDKAGMNELAYSTIALCLGDKVLREVANENTAIGVWAKLQSLYMKKSLSRRIYLKGMLFGFKIQEDKPIEDYLDEFNRIVIDLANIGVDTPDEDQVILILNALPPSYANFVDAMKYGRSSITTEDV